MNRYASSGKSDFNGKSRIGGGDVTRTNDVAIDATGSLLYLHAKVGDTVTRGQTRFGMRCSSLDGLYATTDQIVSPVDGIVATVSVHAGSTINKGDAILTVYPSRRAAAGNRHFRI